MTRDEFVLKAQEVFANYLDVDQDHIVSYVEPLFKVSAPTANPFKIDLLEMGLEIAAQILLCSKVGEDTLATAILFPSIYFHNLNVKEIKDLFAPIVAKALIGVLKMDLVPMAASNQPRFRQSLDNMRKLMLAMVDDFRIVLIKLAERLVVLIHLRDLPETSRLPIALEIQKVYAPLANRMGIGNLKWQLEDLAFRYVNGEEYKRLSQGLQLKRIEREAYVEKVIAICSDLLEKNGIENFSISGRAKHIFSIYKKLQRKNQKEVSDLFDTTAVRILVTTEEQCYNVLSIVNDNWQSIPEEFDDYISQPKGNGYQSIHSAVWGPEGRCVEIQIRTYEMHKAAEGGIASHWAYKETGQQEGNYQQKIDALRDLMNWQSSLVADTSSADDAFKELFSDRAYVFTPNGDVVDLPAGATPLDFAYSVHTQVGDRCKGAKVNGKLVTLTYGLQTGDTIHILTDKNGTPKRDWLDASKGYLKTHRARAKVAHYFKQHDTEQHLIDGKNILDRVVRKHDLPKENITKVREAYKCQTLDELYVMLATGAIGTTTLLNKFRSVASESVAVSTVIEKNKNVSISKGKHAVVIEGLGATETTIAKCCKPIPGDPIVGYITKDRGVVVHHAECSNLLNSMHHAPDKILTVHWNSEKGSFVTNLMLQLLDKPGVLTDIMHVISAAKINIINFNAMAIENGKGRAQLAIEVNNADQLEAIILLLRHMPAVVAVWRV